MLADTEVAAALGWAGRVCAARGWKFEIWSGADPVLLRNVRFLAAGRRAGLIDTDALDKPGQDESWLTLNPGAITTYDIERSYAGHARKALAK